MSSNVHVQGVLLENSAHDIFMNATLKTISPRLAVSEISQENTRNLLIIIAFLRIYLGDFNWDTGQYDSQRHNL